MVNWSDPQIIGAQAAAFVKILLVLLGMYAWEFLNTMSFDYNLLVKYEDFKVRIPACLVFQVLIRALDSGTIVAKCECMILSSPENVGGTYPFSSGRAYTWFADTLFWSH